MGYLGWETVSSDLKKEWNEKKLVNFTFPIQRRPGSRLHFHSLPFCVGHIPADLLPGCCCCHHAQGLVAIYVSQSGGQSLLDHQRGAFSDHVAFLPESPWSLSSWDTSCSNFLKSTWAAIDHHLRCVLVTAYPRKSWTSGKAGEEQTWGVEKPLKSKN